MTSKASEGVSRGLLKDKPGRKLSRANKSSKSRLLSIPGYILEKAGLDPNKELLGLWEGELPVVDMGTVAAVVSPNLNPGHKTLRLIVWEVPSGSGEQQPATNSS